MEADIGLVKAQQRKKIVLALRRENRAVAKPPGVDNIGTPAASLGTGADGEVRWYTDRHFPSLLFRVRWQDDGLWLERRADDGSWIDEPGLLDYFTGHDSGAIELTPEEAARRGV